MNKVVLIGRLTRDPEARYTQGENSMAVVRYSLAVNRRFKREGQPDADFINCVAFGKQGEFAEKYFKKGMQIGVVGHIQTGSYTDKDGNKRYTTDVVVDEQEFTESRKAFEERQGSMPSHTASDMSGNSGFVPVDESGDDDLPF